MLPLEFFDFRRDSRKYRTDCKLCTRLSHKEYYSLNKGAFVERGKTYYQKNKQRIRASQAVYFSNHKEESRLRKNKWYWASKDDPNKSIVKNRERQNALRRERTREKRKTDPFWRLVANTRTRIWMYLKGPSPFRFVESLGCTVEFLRSYIEMQWSPGMTWDNYGKKGWHIDHIVPLASLQKGDTEGLKRLLHHTNLQPLWWYDNLKKGKKTDV